MNDNFLFQSIGQLENLPERVAKLMGWNGDGGIDQAMKELRKASPAKLINAQKLLIGGEVMQFPTIFLSFRHAGFVIRCEM